MAKKAPESQPEEPREVEEVDELEVEDFDPADQHDVVLDPDDNYAEGVDLQGQEDKSGNADA